MIDKTRRVKLMLLNSIAKQYPHLSSLIASGIDYKSYGAIDKTKIGEIAAERMIEKLNVELLTK